MHHRLFSFTLVLMLLACAGRTNERSTFDDPTPAERTGGGSIWGVVKDQSFIAGDCSHTKTPLNDSGVYDEGWSCPSRQACYNLQYFSVQGKTCNDSGMLCPVCIKSENFAEFLECPADLPEFSVAWILPPIVRCTPGR